MPARCAFYAHRDRFHIIRYDLGLAFGKLPRMMNMNPGHDELSKARLMEYFHRSRASVAMSVPAIFTVVAVHWGEVATGRVLGWLFFMLTVQSVRLRGIYKSEAAWEAVDDCKRAALIEVLIIVIAGLGWAGMLFMLDTGRLDFLFLFKIATLAAVLGVTMNSMAVVRPIFLGFMLPVGLTISAYLMLSQRFLQAGEVTSLMLGSAVYLFVLFAVGRHVNRLTASALKERFSREAVFRELQESHRQEMLLREQLQLEAGRLEEANSQLRDLATLDPLTQSYNRRHLMDALSREMNAFNRHGGSFSVIIMDVDDFKHINDSHGHQVGDQVLIGLASESRVLLREIDLFGRWGGEEFLCLLPKAGPEDAVACAERLRRGIESSRLVENHPEVRVTASFGVATFCGDEDADSLVNRADAQLYRAKQSGKNRVMGDSRESSASAESELTA